MKRYIAPELEMKKFVSQETIAASLADFLQENSIAGDAGITTYAAASDGSFTQKSTTTAGELAALLS